MHFPHKLLVIVCVLLNPLYGECCTRIVYTHVICRDSRHCMLGICSNCSTTWYSSYCSLHRWSLFPHVTCTMPSVFGWVSPATFSLGHTCCQPNSMGRFIGYFWKNSRMTSLHLCVIKWSFSTDVRDYLNSTFEGQWICRDGTVTWPPWPWFKNMLRFFPLGIAQKSCVWDSHCFWWGHHHKNHCCLQKVFVTYLEFLKMDHYCQSMHYCWWLLPWATTVTL